MAKIIRLCNKVVIPDVDKEHFFLDFGKVIKSLLANREPHTFFTCLSAFMEWASQTDLPDLNFMVPEDSVVQNLLQMYMEKERIDLSITGSNANIEERLFRLQDDLILSGMQDSDIME